MGRRPAGIAGPRRGENIMTTKFTVGTWHANQSMTVIGYTVSSQALGAGSRHHFSIKGGEWAREACQRYADALNREASVVGTPEHPAAARAAAKLRNEIEAQIRANAERNKAAKAAKPHYRALG
jgi:hypothetical protein